MTNIVDPNQMYILDPAVAALAKLPSHVLAQELFHLANRADTNATKNFLHYRFMPSNAVLELGVHYLNGYRLSDSQESHLEEIVNDPYSHDLYNNFDDFDDLDEDDDDEDDDSDDVDDENVDVEKERSTHIPHRMPELTLSEELSYNLDGDGELHRLIIGENYRALAGMQASLATNPEGVYDLIYIDPPYNTGNTKSNTAGWKYNDKDVAENDSFRHSKWMSEIEPRLMLAKNLLKRSGVIFIAIGNDEQHTLRAMCDSVFERTNFISNVVWNGSRLNNADFVSNGHDYMLVYAKSLAHLDSNKVQWRDPKPGVEEVLAQGERAWKDANGDENAATAAMQAWFKSRPSNDPVQAMKRYVYFLPDGTLCGDADISPPGVGPRYDVLHPVTHEPVPVPSRGWLHSTPERMQQDIDAGYVIFRSDHTKPIRLKKPLEDVTGQVPLSIIERQRTHAKRHIESILGAGSFPYPKDHVELARWFAMAAPKDAKVLDFYGGSGTTAEAVLMLNKRDGGTREVTIVTNDESNIGTEVTRERIVRVMSGEGWADGKSHEGYGGRLVVHRVDVAKTVNFIDCTNEGDHHSWNAQAGMWGAWQNTPIPLEVNDKFSVYTDGDSRRSIVFHNIDVLTCELADDVIGDYPSAKVFLPHQRTCTSNSFYINGVDGAVPLPMGVVSRITLGVEKSVFDPYTKRGGGYMDSVRGIATRAVKAANEEDN